MARIFISGFWPFFHICTVYFCYKNSLTRANIDHWPLILWLTYVFLSVAFFFPCAGVWHFIIFVMQHITSRNWVQGRHENDFSPGYSYFKVYVYTNELVWLSVIICLFSNLYKRSLEASGLTSRKAFALFVRVNYEHFLIFSQIQRASTLHARGNQLCENTRVLAGADFHPLARSEKNEGLLVIC